MSKVYENLWQLFINLYEVTVSFTAALKLKRAIKMDKSKPKTLANLIEKVIMGVNLTNHAALLALTLPKFIVTINYPVQLLIASSVTTAFFHSLMNIETKNIW